MSRLLKDCMNACSCKKEENICDVIDGLGKVVEGIDCAKKIAKEIEKAKKEIEEKTDNSIESVKEEWLALLEKFNSEKWVIGEYKWMPIGSKMPEGWVKVELTAGQTLIQGDKEGNTAGEVKEHYHDFFGKRQCISIPHDQTFYAMNRPTNIELDPETFIQFTRREAPTIGLTRTDPVGGTNNLAAGKFAELWQYKGIDEKKKNMKKCLEKYLEDYMDCIENSKKK
ncbi:hypothetical protein [Spiroplasma platyhelix]|uniref:Uncharacterized protein n=1 Tax=Spiroplasma platyhelix PALS-1 TaxID=1276218 RepID=A0A846TW04_9MOLU|nr:hypothetical protein [Spiroplasma platyhelix]MBE4703788.1 hypothetical protein [Spiroplasma platyhelix PALS-1]NKE38161.1 hypothetical protein [Spiroplasma platyhelix PALS-1]UJB29046.1 hypothetical protein SPLAT_v1c02820 [Spiroplasma platyhelix PALS-1]